MRANSPRVTAGVLAVAIASFALVTYRGAFAGYPSGFAGELRALAGGEILVFSRIDVLKPGAGPEMEWRPWNGQSWQSYLEYYFPGLATQGYLAFPSTPPWSPLDIEVVAGRIRGVPGVLAVLPYHALPCYVETSAGRFEAILRARDPDLEEGLYSMSGYLVDGRLWVEGAEEAVVPARTGDRPLPVRVGEAFWLFLPAPGESHGEIDWAAPSGFHLVNTGKYDMSLPLAARRPDAGATEPEAGAMTEDFPRFDWDRPEILVTEPAFRNMCSRAGWKELPCYQLGVRIRSMSEIESVAADIRRVLGDSYSVFTVPELGKMRAAGAPQPVGMSDTRKIMLAMSYLLSGTIVSGTVYVLISQSRRKIGLLKVIGATSGQISVYAYSMILGVFLLGSAVGYFAGESLRFLLWTGSATPVASFMRGALTDAALILAAAAAASVVTGSSVVLIASRFSCTEVLARGQA